MADATNFVCRSTASKTLGPPTLIFAKGILLSQNQKHTAHTNSPRHHTEKDSVSLYSTDNENSPLTSTTIMAESPKPEKRSKFGRFLGLMRTKRSPERESDSEVLSGADADPEKLPTSVAIAQDRLNKAGEKLKKKLPADLLASGDFEIKVSADVNSVADNIGSTLDTFMEQRDVEKSEQSHAREFITEWAKKTIPYIETGTTIANVEKPLDEQETDSARTLFHLRII